MNRIKFIVALLLTAISLLYHQVVLAVPAAPSSPCDVAGTVADVQRQNFERKTGTCKGRAYDYYSVQLTDVSSSGGGAGDAGDPDSCRIVESRLKEGQGLLLIMPGDMYSTRPVKTGDQITAVVEFSGDECFNGLFIRKVEVR